MDLMARMFPYSREASWAVWERGSDGRLTGNPAFLEDAAQDIHPRAMLISLNPASAGVSEPEQGSPAWSNFHSIRTKHNDIFLAHALIDTPFWGSYMTDLHPNVRESKSGNVRPTTEAIAESVRSLIDQAMLLDGVQTLIGVGGVSFKTLQQHASAIDATLGEVTILGIPHYSRANAAVHKNQPALYRERVHAALGLSA